MHAFLGLLAVAAALRVPGPLSPRNANYRIEARLDTDAHVVTGRAHLSWRNPTAQPARELVFHLYMNAFKNELSTFLRESRGVHRRSHMEKHGWGAIDVTRISVDRVDLTAALRVDDTLATLPLAAPVAGGATVEIDVEWKTTLPKVFARTGWHDDFYAVAQWFPKIAVFDDGKWRAHQHHLNSEFFADFGVYDVTLDVPARFVVAATGVILSETAQGERKTLRVRAEDVHDFAFVACPRFRVTTEDVGGVEVALYGLPGHAANWPRHLAAARVALDELGRRLGPYPYARLTIVDVPMGAEGAGGMEYPTMILTAEVPVPRAVHLPELVTLHELAHQWFYGMVASDEVEEAWLDEGLTETMTDILLSRMFGSAAADYEIAGHRLSHTEASRLGYRRYAAIDPPEQRAFDFLSLSSYGAITYAKTDALMRTVEGLIGAERFERGLRRYFETWRFRHPRADDFVAAFDAGAGEDLGWLWDATLRAAKPLDYEVLSIETRARPPAAGLFDVDGGARSELTPQPDKGSPHVSEVVVHRRGEVAFPVEVRVVFADGQERRERWDGGRSDGARWRRFTYEGAQPAAWAAVDPVALDGDRWNDGRRATDDAAPRTRVESVWQLALSTLLATVGF
jgi:hypothetical protein